MTSERLTPTSTHLPSSGARFRRPLYTIMVALAMLAISAASAAAHTVVASAKCASVTFNWALFSPTGNGNGGLNTPVWAIVFKPTSGSPTTLNGAASFAGSTYSLTVAIPSGNGVVTASSSWTSSQTRDWNSNSSSTTLTLANCAAPITPPIPVVHPAVAVTPAPTTVTPTVAAGHPVASAALALSTTGSPPAALGGRIHDTAVLSGGSSPTGKITFALYSASDATCSTVLHESTVAVSGDGSYTSPSFMPMSTGSYQWVASYGGDANNQSVSGSCNDPTERSTVTASLCVRSPVALLGVPETAKNSLSAYVPAAGVKSVTFYLDGRRLVTLTKPSHQRFSIAIDVRTLSYGIHRLSAKLTMLGSSCATEATGSFIRTEVSSRSPTFAG
jgi:hypothetical protein